MSTPSAAIAADRQRVFIPFRPAERKAFKKRQKLNGPDWAEKNIVVTGGSRPGRYQHKNNPALYGILELGSRSHIRKLVIGKGIQTGGTLGVYILVLREGDYSSGNDNALITMADEGTVKKLSKGRLRKMIDQSPELAALKSANPDDTAIKSITLSNGFMIDAAWISSETSVSSESYRVLVLDEISKKAYQKHRGHIADAEGRTTVYPDTKKVFVLSSPDEDCDDASKRDPLLDQIESCDVSFDYHVVCPDCGTEQVMVFERFGWPEQPSLIPGASSSANPAEIRRLKSAWYECSHCKSRWNDYKRDKAVLAAMKTGWKPSMELDHFQSAYVHLPSWLSPYVSLSEVVARWLEAQEDDDLLKKWYTLIAGVTYRREKKQERKEEQILRLVDEEMPRGIVPRETSTLLILADTQQIGFMYQVVSFGWGQSLRSHLVDHGFVENFDDLKSLGEQDWFDSDGKLYRCQAGFIDSGGGSNPFRPKHTRTVEVYDFCRLNKLWRPLKGQRRDNSTPWEIKRQDFYPTRDGKKKPIPGGLKRYNIDVTLYKNRLADKLNLEPGSNGSLTLHAGLLDGGPHSGKKYALQLCAEVQDVRGYWECPNGKANHFWDCWVYGFAAADILGVARKKRTTDASPPVEREREKKASPESYRSLPNWRHS